MNPQRTTRTLPRPADRVTDHTPHFTDALRKHRERQQWHGVRHFTEPTTNPKFITVP